MNIPLGFEIETGARVVVPANHMVVLGQTQLSGKTTTLEALVDRSGLRAVAFITKPGEKSFRLAHSIPAFFSESTLEEYWKHVAAILEYRSESRLGPYERGMLIKLCQDYAKEGGRSTVTRAGKSKRVHFSYEWEAPETLEQLLANIETYLPNAKGREEIMCLQLREYLAPAIAEIKKAKFADRLELAPGINVMDITELSDGLKTLVIRSVIEHVHKRLRKTVVIVPEAWKFIPEGRTTPVKLALEGLIREGAAVENFVWMDSQDLRGVDKKLLRSVIVWLFGVQRQRNEIAMTLDSIPDYPKPTATQIMELGKGQFYVCYSTTLRRTYVQPAGMEEEHAKAIAVGDLEPETWKGIEAALKREQREIGRAARVALGSAERGDNPALTGGMRGLEQETAGPQADTSTAREYGNPDPQDGPERERADRAREREEIVYREKYEALKLALASALEMPTIDAGEEFDHAVINEIARVRAAHDAALDRVAKLEKHSARSVPAESAGGAHPTLSAPSARNGDHPNPFDLPSLESVWAYILERAATDGAAQVLKVLQHRPELFVTVERKVIHAEATTLRGSLGVLIANKFFDDKRPMKEIRQELTRRGFMQNKTPDIRVYSALAELVQWGFLTKEGSEFLAVEGMKINIEEARA